MEKNLEIEFKLLLDQDHYKEMLKLFNGIDPYVQVNHYFDTKDHKLLSKRNMLRVRFKNDTYEFTLKRMGEIGLNEYNEMIDQDKYELLKQGKAFDSEIFKLLLEDNVTASELRPTYDLKTTRYDLEYQGGILSLDHSEYLDTEDYELEYEVIDYAKGKQIFLDLVHSYGLEYTMNCHGKRHRVYDRLEELAKQ